jgi:methylated-DNA-[protein]-cysteine S-methyltransferase
MAVSDMNQAFTVFETAIGACGIVWGPGGVVGVQLPEESADATRGRLQARFPGAREGAPPAKVKQGVARIRALLDGGREPGAIDLSGIELDMSGVPPFARRVYEVARTIPPGRTASYGEIAARLESPGAARAVGQALGKNPFAIVVPCHRVLAAGGKPGGFSANGGVATKRRMLVIEGAPVVTAQQEIDLTPAPAPSAAAGLGFDPVAAVAHLRATDPKLAKLIDAVGPVALQRNQTSSLFLALAEAIVYQQLSGKAAATIYGRVCALFPRAKEGPTPAHILRVSDEKLRGAGLSRSKLLSLRDLARRTADGALPSLEALQSMEDEAIIEILTEVRGIGRWTAEMLLIFRLGRPDVLPADDYGVRKGFMLTYGKRDLPTRQQLEKHGARWRPFRTAASWYLWRALELGSR